MKKVFIIVLVLALLAVGATAAFADEVTDQELLERHEEMLEEKQEWLDELVAEGVITQEEADEFLENMEERFQEGYCLTEDGLGMGGRMFADNEDGWFGGWFQNDDSERTFGGGMYRSDDDDVYRGAGRGFGCGFGIDD